MDKDVCQDCGSEMLGPTGCRWCEINKPCSGCGAPPDEECQCDKEDESYQDTARKDNPDAYF